MEVYVDDVPKSISDAMELKYDIGQASDVGVVRPSNEDCLLSLRLGILGATGINICLFAIADGLGGHAGGEIASSIALKMLAENITGFFLFPESQEEHCDLYSESLLQVLMRGVKEANNAVFSRGQILANYMGTTLVAAMIIENTAYIASIGDSRAYCLDGGHLRQVTTDHSIVTELVSMGKILPQDIHNNPQRNILTRCLGTQQDADPDLFKEVLNMNKALLLCSDGLWDLARDAEIESIMLRSNSPQDACDQLIKLARQQGGVDNASAIIVKVMGEEG
jgi:serine/threonine protein phosphatase PrpC